MIRRRDPDAGFTLVELIVTVSITLILLAVSIGSYLGVRTYRSDTTAKAALQTASEHFQSAKATRSLDDYTPAQIQYDKRSLWTDDSGVRVDFAYVGSARSSSLYAVSPTASYSPFKSYDTWVLKAQTSPGRYWWYTSKTGTFKCTTVESYLSTSTCGTF